MASVLQLELERLSNQARFISMIVSKELVVSSRKKADIVAELRKRDFKPFPKISKAKAAGETEEAVEEDEEEQDENSVSHDFDYLLNMAISSLTKERVSRSIQFSFCACHQWCSLFRFLDREAEETSCGQRGRAFASS